METQKLFLEMEELWKTFQDNHTKFTESKNKSAGGRARKAIGEIKMIVTEYRKTSVEESKKL